jgi:hypothetical protein
LTNWFVAREKVKYFKGNPNFRVLVVAEEEGDGIGLIRMRTNHIVIKSTSAESIDDKMTNLLCNKGETMS